MISISLDKLQISHEYDRPYLAKLWGLNGYAGISRGVITPASTGVANKGLLSTGSPELSTIWTYMGLPTISLPLLSGENNLPLGVQLVGDKLDDLRFLASANWLEKNCKEKND